MRVIQFNEHLLNPYCVLDIMPIAISTKMKGEFSIVCKKTHTDKNCISAIREFQDEGQG